MPDAHPSGDCPLTSSEKQKRYLARLAGSKLAGPDPVVRRAQRRLTEVEAENDRLRAVASGQIEAAAHRQLVPLQAEVARLQAKNAALMAEHQPQWAGPRSAKSCSFCRKSKAEVKTLIESPGGAVICNECVTRCNTIIADNCAEDFENRRAPNGLGGP